MNPLMAAPETALVAAPALGATLAFMLGPRAHRPVALFMSVLTLAGLAGTVLRLLYFGPYVHELGGWLPPLGITWRIDGLTAVMLLLSTFSGIGVSLYSLGYFDPETDRRKATAFWPLWGFLWAAMNALFLSRDLFNWYVTLELSTLTAVALVTLTHRPAALAGGMRYLLMALAASLLYLLGVGLLYAEYGRLDLDGLAAVLQDSLPTRAAMLLMTAGLLVKAALFPLHFWLPTAHASAPSPVSAALSALVIKGGFYILLRLMMDLWPANLAGPLALGLGALGGAAILWGSVLAILQQRIKRLIAFSTVAQLGYLFLMFPLMDAGRALGGEAASRAWAGGIYQALAHGLAKAALFLAAGVVIHARGHDRMDGLVGVGPRLPMTATAMALAGISLMGIPPGAGFLAKWLTLTAAMSVGQWPWVILVLAGGLLAVVYLFRIFQRLMATGGEPIAHPPPRVMELAALGLAILSILFGISALPVFALLRIGAPEDLLLYLEITP